MWKSILFALGILAVCGCNNNDQAAPSAGNDSPQASIPQDSSSRFIYNFTDTVLQAKITDTLMQLPFIKESNRYIDSISHHKQGISFITDTASNEISVMAGYNGKDRFETYYHFSIRPQTFDIKVMDPLTSDFVPLADYLKKTKEPE